MGFKKFMKWHSNFKNTYIEKVILYKIDAYLLSFTPKSDTKLFCKVFRKTCQKTLLLTVQPKTIFESKLFCQNRF